MRASPLAEHTTGWAVREPPIRAATSEMPLKVVAKVVAYVTRGNSLLVFRHLHVPEAGIQIPAGTLEPGESSDDGVLREAQEETGLDCLAIHRFLGTRDYDVSPYGLAELHHHSYYHLHCKGDKPLV